MKEADEKEVTELQDDEKDQDIFETKEIKVEEMAIDGICGVY